MEGTEPTLMGAMPGALFFLGDLFFRWVPATIIALTSVSTTSPFANLTEPIAAWDVPLYLSQAAGAAGYESLLKGWYIFSLISFLVSIPFLAVILYCLVRIVQIRRRERAELRAAQRTVAVKDIPKTQLRWNRVVEQASSSKPDGWRLAILEADIMLGELLDLQGYKGETMADKMKRVDRAQFNSIDDAWEAHKVRNRVAHEGSAHTLTPREVRRIIGLYERVFKEFKYVQ